MEADDGELGNVEEYGAHDDASEEHSSSVSKVDDGTSELAMLPARMEAAFDEAGLTEVRPTIISAGKSWLRESPRQLGSVERSHQFLDTKARSRAKDATFDLLDLLTRAGALNLASAELHIVVCNTVSFEHCLVDVLVKRNLDILDRVDKSLALASNF